MMLLGGGRSFKRKGLLGSLLLIEGVPLRGIAEPQTLLLSFFVCGHDVVAFASLS